jgi:hypothetical protein
MTEVSTTSMLRIIRLEWRRSGYHKSFFGHPHGDEMIHKIRDGPVSNSFASFTYISDRRVMKGRADLQMSIRPVEL